MDTTRIRAVSITEFIIRASKEAAEDGQPQKEAEYTEALVFIISGYLPLNLCLLYLMERHLSTREKRLESIVNKLCFCAETTNVRHGRTFWEIWGGHAAGQWRTEKVRKRWFSARFVTRWKLQASTPWLPPPYRARGSFKAPLCKGSWQP